MFGGNVKTGQGLIVNAPVSEYAAALAKLRRLYGNKAQIQLGYIRLEKVLASGDVQVNWTASGQGQNKRTLEQYLSDSDNFVCMEASLVIYKQLQLTGNFQRAGNAPLFGYPDKTRFYLAATGANVSEADALEVVYNGKLSMKSNSNEIINVASTQVYRTAPITQYTAALQPSHGQFGGDQRTKFHQPIVLEGKKKNEILIIPAEGADTVQIAGDPAVGLNIMAYIMYGWTVRNASEPTTIPEFELYIQNGALI
jgi:hypothetical protein